MKGKTMTKKQAWISIGLSVVILALIAVNFAVQG